MIAAKNNVGNDTSMVVKVNHMRQPKNICPQDRTVANLQSAARNAVDNDTVLGKLPEPARRFISENIYACFVSTELKRELRSKDV